MSVRGPDDALLSAPLDCAMPWSFAAGKAGCELVRRNRQGEPLWRIAGSPAFDRATVGWNPVRFAGVYGSVERAWSTGLGLSLLVLSLRDRGGLVLHAAAAAVDGHGILCVGASGAGKSTLARLLDASGCMVLTDERPVLRQWPAPGGGIRSPSAGFRVYGSPWPSSAGFARNGWAPLRRI
ncbi:MAG: hypothetical protein FJ276_36215, partial [Planctomycetes bacterium]|nr:hypothetical protein [Planctomycetota bacterium]